MNYLRIPFVLSFAVVASFAACDGAGPDEGAGAPEGEASEALATASMRPGKWTCSPASWSAATTRREMRGATHFECGGSCGDTSHSQPTTWVDIVGGISQACDDHSSSFFGPQAGEWDGCAAGGTQVSTGYKTIDSVKQNWDRFPWAYRVGGTYATCDIGFLLGSEPMNQPYATVYDLDYCINKQLVGTVYWPNFDVTASLASGSLKPSNCNSVSGIGHAVLGLTGKTGLACSQNENACTNVVCSDLEVYGTIQCDWTPPQVCGGPGAACSAYHNPNDTSCCSNFCNNFHCI